MEVWALVMFAVAILLFMLGYPVAFTLGAVSMLFGGIFLGLDFFNLLPLRIWGIMTNFTLLAVPLFVFMGILLEKSGIAEELLETMGALFGGLRGGMAISIIIVGTLLAATTGVVGATVVTMTVIALPALLKNGYQPELASGTIAAAGTLGQIIPPSIVLILLGDVMGVPVGQLFMSAVVPGLILVLCFILYIVFLGRWRPAELPDRSIESQNISIARALKGMMPPLILVIAVLGSIFFGVATPTESAALGAVGALLLAFVKRRLSLDMIKQATTHTTRLTSMVFMILIGATAFGLVFRGLGGDYLVENLLTQLPGGVNAFIALSMLMIFVLGFFLDFLEICFIVVPILAPIAELLGINMLWYGVLIAMNLQTSFLTPPFGFSLFYLKAAATVPIRIGQIYKGVMPFVILQIFTLALLFIFPDLVLWLPDLMDRVQAP
ncbi:MAG: C4-dicarboxylate ABC transporter [Gammaproteobacteria bacterium]|nr:TRAP transporter large permease subunit [Gammaproteobacteria bacterium]PCH63089.1 MAG: C4-dicarboxylate ABC transporter [Gammaproteobacteria bacterium]PCH64275.1 MAG: C4-dicarboxylate ABC transporter [Gammaproteobacteria bacterium]